MKKIKDITASVNRPIKIAQFGEGNFLRAFVDFYVQEMNDKNNFNGNVAIIKSIREGSIDAFEAQGNLYTVLLRGKIEGKTVERAKIINSIGFAVDLHKDYSKYIALAESRDLKIIISNTTEAGITFNIEDKADDKFGVTYPAKLTQFLYHRFKEIGSSNDSGLYIVPCELIDNNATELKSCIDKYISLWNLPNEFKMWNDNCNYYCNSLVDRIVTGRPAEISELCAQLGYEDSLLDVAEPFGLWVIEEKGKIADVLKAEGLNKIIFVPDVKYYKTRKVRLLNGAHTSLVPVAFLSGLDTVGEAMVDKQMGKFIRETLNNEIIPTVPLPYEELKEFADAVIERFENPFVNHKLLSISLNSVSKWKVRVLPSFKGYYIKEGQIPERLSFSLACLIEMYRAGEFLSGEYRCNFKGKEYIMRDEDEVLNLFNSIKSFDDEKVVDIILGTDSFWGEDLRNYNGLQSAVYSYVKKIKDLSFEGIKSLAGGFNE
jgi:tagaturonate reductase